MGWWERTKKAGQDIGAVANPVGSLVGNQIESTFTGKPVKNDPFTAFDKKFISGDWDAKRAENKRKDETLANDKSVQDGFINNQENRGKEYFTGAEQRAGDRYKENREFLGNASRNLDSNTTNVGRYEGDYRGKQEALESQAKKQSQDATAVYETMTPHYNDMINYANKEAKSAMTLSQAMDPNNDVATSTRGLYDKYGNDLRGEYNKEAGAAQAGYNTLAGQAQSGYTDLAAQTQGNYDQYGQASQDRFNTEGTASRQRFEDAAAGENKTGLANYGVLASLGAQAANSAQGQGPSTLGQQMGAIAASNRQAGEAYSNTQRRIQSLKDQGMMSESELRRAGLGSRDQYASEGLGKASGQRQTGLASSLGLKEKGVDAKQSLRNQGLAGQQNLRERGLQEGFNRSDIAYNMGLDSRDRYRNSLVDRENLTDRNVSRQSSLRGEQSGYQGNQRSSSANQENTRFNNTLNRDTLSRDTELSRLSDIDALRAGQLDYGTGITNMRMGRQDVNTERTLGSIQAQTQAREAEEYRRRQMVAAGIQGVGTAGGAVAGGMMGGPGGAMMGAQAGGAVGGSVGSGFSGQAPQQSFQGAQGAKWDSSPNAWGGQPMQQKQMNTQVLPPDFMNSPNRGMPQPRYNIG